MRLRGSIKLTTTPRTSFLFPCHYLSWKNFPAIIYRGTIPFRMRWVVVAKLFVLGSDILTKHGNSLHEIVRRRPTHVAFVANNAIMTVQPRRIFDGEIKLDFSTVDDRKPLGS